MRSPPNFVQGDEPPTHEVRCEECDWNAFAVSEYTAEKIQRMHIRGDMGCAQSPEVIELDAE